MYHPSTHILYIIVHKNWICLYNSLNAKCEMWPIRLLNMRDLDVVQNNAFRHAWSLQYLCQELPLHYLADKRQQPFYRKLLISDNGILHPLSLWCNQNDSISSQNMRHINKQNLWITKCGQVLPTKSYFNCTFCAAMFVCEWFFSYCALFLTLLHINFWFYCADSWHGKDRLIWLNLIGMS